MISCLMVTQDGRREEILRALQSFDYQSYSDRELIIVHDGEDEFDEHLNHIAKNYPLSRIRIFKNRPGQTLGELRNSSIDYATGEIICQWDDDDLCHPQRLALQHEFLCAQKSDFCFLVDQLHLFLPELFLFWDDWSVENYPGNLIQGTMMGKKSRMPRYPALPKGEDTELLKNLIRAGHNISELKGYGWLHIYTFHGQNAWALDHHKAISQWKRLKHDRLVNKLKLLETEIPRYQLPWPTVQLLHEKGSFEINQ